MRKSLLISIFLLTIMVLFKSFSHDAQGSDGRSSADGHPLAAKAHDVFARVAAAADKPGDRYPTLVIAPDKVDIWAKCLEDGQIVLSQKSLEVCYHGVSDQVGSARLAFIIGHEIAHLAKGDFWHNAVSEFMGRYDSEEKGLKELNKIVRDFETIKVRELRADSYGLLYAFMAGYDPDVIVNRTDTNFFREWANQLSGRIAYNDKLYPSAKQRANFLLGYLENIKMQIAVFELGLRFYQKGDYDEALECLTYFRRQFPCREVFNNIGLVYYQKAFNDLAVFNPKKAYRFKLATVIDTETRAEFGTRGLATTEDFNRTIEHAIENFEAARERDFHYIPARVNLASASILSGDYSRALALSKEAIKIKKDDQNAWHNYAIALYLFGRNENIGTTEKAVEILNDILDENPAYPYHLNALYNLGTLFFEQGKESKAEKVWRRYLKVGPMEGYAERIIKKIGETSKKPSKENYQSAYQIPPPIKIGHANRETKKKLKDFSKISIDLTTAEATYYTKDAVKVLVIRGFVQHVETSAVKTTKLSDVLLRYGRPNRIISAASGLQTFVYEKFALDIRDDRTLKVIYFKEID